MPGASPANKISIGTNQKGRAAANRPGAPPYHKHIRGQIMSKRIHGIGIGLALLLFVCLPALGQVIGLTPTPLANYYWNTTTASWTVCPNSSAVEASPNLPQAIALYGFNTSLGMWTPETSCYALLSGATFTGPVSAPSLTLGTPLTVPNGGTGATTAAGAWINIFSGAGIAANCSVLTTNSSGALICGSLSGYALLTGAAFTGTVIAPTVGVGTSVPLQNLSVAGGYSTLPAAGSGVGASVAFLAGTTNNGYGTLFGQLATGHGYIQEQRVDSGVATYPLELNPNGSDVLINTETDCGSALCVNGAASATAFISTVATGTAPLTIVSTTPVANLAIIQTAHQISSPLKCADTSGSGTVQSCTTSPSFTPAANDCIIYTTTTTNTSTALSLNVNSLGADSVAKWQGTTTLAAGDVPANKPVLACLDAANHWDLSTIGNVPGGSSGTRAATQKNVTSPSGPANTGSYTMQGLAGTITPAVSGNILITISGTIYGSTLTTAGDGINFFISYGTGVAPTNGAATTGTQPTNGVQYNNPTTVTSTDVHVPFSTSAVVSGLTLSTAYWVDLTAEAIGAAGFTLNNVSVSIIEN
jgi:hypothetical protein